MPTERPTHAFATFSPYKSRWDAWWSQVTLLLGESNALAVRQQKFLHSMQFCPVNPRALRRLGLYGPRVKHGALLFMSYYNGSRDAYFEGFGRGLWANMNEVWRYCVGWKLLSPPVGSAATQNLQNVNRFIDAHERPASSFFCAYKEGSASIRAALVLLREIDQLRAIAIDPEQKDERFNQAFERLAQRLWGNAS